MLKCLNCKQEFEEAKLDFLRCPNCDNKILFKVTAPIMHTVKVV